MLPKIEQILHDHLIALDKAQDHRPPENMCVRASSVGKCARAIGFGLCGLEATNPPAPDSLFNFWLGNRVHDITQQAILAKWPDAETEKAGQFEGWLFGHSDVLYTAEDGETVVLEIKSMADFAFERATGVELKSNGRWRRKEKIVEGPKREHKLQAGLYALMHGAKYVAIVYVRKTAAKDEVICWEWRYTFDELKDGVEVEIERLRTILNSVKNGVMPDREFEGQVISNPPTTKWPCLYCNFLDACIQLGAGEVVIDG